MAKRLIRWGIIGLGKIAHKFAEGLQYVENAQLIAVASRDLAKAQQFAKDWKIPYSYGSYEELPLNTEVDVVYIATPHTLHYEYTILCMEHKKAVLCEKPFAMNRREVQEMIALARKEQVFLMEALWTKFLPSFQKVITLVESGAIGELNMIQADFGFKAPFNENGRLFNKRLGGGALLDIGIYPLFLSITLLGKPNYLKAIANFGTTGVDINCGMLLQYQAGKMAVLSCSFASSNSIEANIFGTEARIRMSYPFHTHQTKIELIRNFHEIETITFDAVGNGYNYEAEEVIKCLQDNRLESQIMSHQDSMDLMEVLDWVREEAGIMY